MPDHSDLPWTASATKRYGDGFWIGNDAENVAHVPGYQDHPQIAANAAFIVRAANNHYALVDALESALAYIEPDTDWPRADRVLKEINAVLDAVKTSSVVIVMKEPKRIFVFGSNLAGRHGKGAALHAVKEHGAEYGKGVGRTGMAYAIPTKGHWLEVLSLAQIKRSIDDFIAYAKEHPELRFQVTPIGTGLAGYSHDQIKPMFAAAPSNCDLPEEWK